MSGKKQQTKWIDNPLETLTLLMILNFLDEVDGGDTQKKQLVNPHVELRK